MDRCRAWRARSASPPSAPSMSATATRVRCAAAVVAPGAASSASTASRAARGELDTRFEGWLGGVQLGIDAFRLRGDDGAQDAGGFSSRWPRPTATSTAFAIGIPDAYAGSSDLNGPSFGAYYTHIGPSNWYVDASPW